MYARIHSLQVVAELKKRAEEIAHTLTMESGKPIKDARGEVARTIDTFQVAAEESTRIYGEHIPLDISARNKGLQVNSFYIFMQVLMMFHRHAFNPDMH